MKQREMSYVLKMIDAIALAVCLVLVFVVVPNLELSGLMPPGSVWLFFMGVAPMLIIGCRAWGIFSDIGKDKSFTDRNAKRLRFMAYVAAVDVLLWLSVAIVFSVFTPSGSLGPIVMSLVGLIGAVFIAALCAALSHLTAKAAALKTENDLVV